MRFLKWVVARLGGNGAVRVVLAVALVLALPSLTSPLFIDEYVQAVKWRASLDRAGPAGLGHFLEDCFVFAGGSPAANLLEAEHGHGAWWTAPDFRVAFWRPLAAATHALDLALWPRSAVLMHAQSLLWFLALLLAVGALYRRFLGPRVAALALALYAWDDARGMVLAWVANRSALLATLAGVGVLLAHDRWRRDGWRPGAWLAPLLLALGLASGEMAVAVTGFLLGHALCLDTGPLARRLARLVPYALVVVAWQGALTVLGFGVAASGAYVHPLHEPLAFAVKLVERAPILALGQLTPLAADAWGMYPPAMKPGVYLLALAVLVLVGRLVRTRLGADPQARFWLLGAGLSLVLLGATGPQDRNLVYVGLGVAPALALLIMSLVDDPPTARWPRLVVVSLAVFNLVLAPLLLPVKCLTMLALQGMVEPVNASIPRDPGVIRKTLVVVWTAFEPAVYYSWMKRDAAGVPRPGRTRILAVSARDVAVTRTDAVTLRLRPGDGFFAGEASQVFRGPSRPYRLGEVVELSNTRVAVIELTEDRRPRTVEFRFGEPLESPGYLWMRGGAHGLVAWTPPRVGETVVVPVVR